MDCFIRIPYQTSNEWLELRGKGIGGSDSATIIGLNPYKTNQQLWLEKIGNCKPVDISDKDCVKYGKNAEEHIRALFALEHSEFEVLHSNELLVSRKYDFIRASLDGELIERDTGRRGVLEIKTTDLILSMSREKWKDKIPDNYFCQVLHYLFVTGYDFAVLRARMIIHSGENKIYKEQDYYIERIDVEKDIEILINAEVDFWNNYVLTKKEPSLKINL